MKNFLKKLDPWLIVYAGLMGGLYVKVAYLAALYLDGVQTPVSHPLFPDFFTSGKVALIAYLAPLVTPLVLFLGRSQNARKLAAAILLGANAVLLCHIAGYNDATYTSGVWVSLYLLWSATPREAKQLIFFGKALIGLFFLGGAVGKFTAEYWDGSALHDIYFMQKQNFPFPYLRDSFSVETVRSMATGFSRITVFAEALLGTVIFWSIRPAAAVIIPMIIGMIFLSQFQLFSVVGPLLFLVFALILERARFSPECRDPLPSSPK